MGVTIKKKVVVAEDDLTPRQQKALDDVFGTPDDFVAPAPKPKAAHVLMEGQHVVITNDKFPWVQHYKPGDTGVVKQHYPDSYTVNITPNYDPVRDALYQIELDNPRQPQFSKVDFPRWAFEPLHAVHKIGE